LQISLSFFVILYVLSCAFYPVFYCSCCVRAYETDDDDDDDDDYYYCGVAPPVLVNSSPDVVVRNEGDDVSMFCDAKATPSATLTWLKDGRKLAAASGHVTVAGNHVTLRGVERSDAGVYSCTFKNVAGIASHLIKLVVHGAHAVCVQTDHRE